MLFVRLQQREQPTFYRDTNLITIPSQSRSGFAPFAFFALAYFNIVRDVRIEQVPYTHAAERADAVAQRGADYPP
jgi:hypothetical protein